METTVEKLFDARNKYWKLKSKKRAEKKEFRIATQKLADEKTELNRQLILAKNEIESLKTEVESRINFIKNQEKSLNEQDVEIRRLTHTLDDLETVNRRISEELATTKDRYTKLANANKLVSSLL